jgi:glycosyltransferase involved in cell wall biosynthesis
MKALQLVRRATTLDLHPLARRARIGIQRLLGGASGEKPAPGGKGSDRPDPRAIEAVRKRNRHVLECLSAMDLFIAPSRFLCDEMVAFGVDASRVVVSDYGFPACGARARSRPLTGGRLRLAFLGNLQPHKGLHVLVEAFRLQPSDSLSLEVWGSPEHAPAYVRELRRRDPRVVFRGEFGPQERGRVLDEIDILVFPSIWYENSPLTIHEAFQAGIPVVASDLGGMAELVIPLRNGLTFRAGDATDLARQLGRLESEPGLVSRLSRGALETRVKTVEEDARELVSRFSSLVARRRKEGET